MQLLSTNEQVKAFLRLENPAHVTAPTATFESDEGSITIFLKRLERGAAVELLERA
jgi:hypothetical protein